MWITHNFMRWFDGYDHYTMSDDLDIASWDWYVGMGHTIICHQACSMTWSAGLKERISG